MHFLIHHTFKLDQNVDEFWAVRDGVISAIDNEKDSNFESLSCLPIGRNGPVFCMWEGKEGMTAEHMQTYIDIRFGKWFINNVMTVDDEFAKGKIKLMDQRMIESARIEGVLPSFFSTVKGLPEKAKAAIEKMSGME